MIGLKVYPDERLDFFGDELNRRIDPKRLKEAKALDVYDVVDFIKCVPDWKYLTPDQSILGMTVFSPTSYYVWSKPFFTKGDLPQEIFLERGTILIDRTLNEGNRQKQQMENFTVIHECFHWLLHQAYFSSTQSDPSLCCSESSIFANASHQDSTFQILEHQANRCAASFLMSSEAVKNEFMTIARLKNIPQLPLPLRNMKKYIAQAAARFNVNFNPMLYRLQELGFIQK